MNIKKLIKSFYTIISLIFIDTRLSIEEVEKVLIKHPEIIVKALESKPELIYGLLAKITPWDKLATKDDIKLLIDLMDKRFEDINRRFEDVNKRFEDVNKRFEDINARFEDINKRFEDMRYYIDKRIGFLEKLIVSFDIPILVGLIIALIRIFI